METIGYHTCEDRDNPEYVEENAPFPSMGSMAFLGFGYYFWEESLDLAHWWGSVHCSNVYMICQSNISCPDKFYFDLLGNPKHRNHLRGLVSDLNNELIREFGTTEVPLGLLITFFKKLNSLPKTRDIFPFKVIRAVDSSKPSQDRLQFINERPNYIDLSPRSMICLTEKSKVFLTDLRIVYPEKYVI